MSPSKIIIIIFGSLFILYLYRNNENFNLVDSLGVQVNRIPIEQDYGMKTNDMLTQMEPVLNKEEHIREKAVSDFQKEALKSINIENYYLTDRETPYDLKRHDYKFEKNPQEVIDEMEKNNEPIELRNVYNKTVKDYKAVNPSMESLPSLDMNNYTYLENVNVELEDNGLKPAPTGTSLTPF